MSENRNEGLRGATPPPPPAAQSPPPLPSDVEVPELSLPSPAVGRRRALVRGLVLLVLAVAIGVGLKARHRTSPVAPASAPPIAAAPATPTPVIVPAAQPASPSASPPAPPVEIALDPAPARSRPAEKPGETPSASTGDAEAAAPRHRRRRHGPRAHERRRGRLAHASTKKPAGDRTAARAAYDHGNGLLFGGDAGAAVAAYQEAVRRAPSDPIGYRGLGLAYEKEGKTKEAIAALVSYLKLSKHAHDREVIARRLYRLTHADDGSLAR